MKQEISKKGFKAIVWITLLVGVVINAITSTILLYGWIKQLTLNIAFFMGFGMLLVGFGMGLATSRAFKIKGVDTN